MDTINDSEKARKAIQSLHENLKGLPSPRVLLVDDSKEDAIILRHSLDVRYPHVSLDWMDNATSALAAAKARNYDLILLDLLFHSGMSGVAIFQSLRQATSVPIVGLTGLDADALLVKEASHAGIEAILFKSPSDLLSNQNLDLIFSTPLSL